MQNTPRNGNNGRNGTSKQQAIAGILGGVGPLAHTAFERQLIEKNAQRGATSDQDHPIWFLASATDIPDRSLSLQSLEKSCAPGLIRYGNILANAGSDFLVVPCNTAHAFHDEVQPELTIPWIHMIDCVIDALRSKHQGARRIGILATDGTLQTQLYHDRLSENGFDPIAPELGSVHQERLMRAIYDSEHGIKTTGDFVSPDARRLLRASVNWAIDQEVDLVITACTEISVGFEHLDDVNLPWIDPLEIMADVTLDLCFGRTSIEQTLLRSIC